ncbi:hypothetical protein [Bacillus badius]|uniref:Phage protein n=1 Tax=Bacillus badius TaxID=1455 RepID=A0ABR5ANT6_BACBA|nr:hypothetical protein [Bacillus badius]KIL72703.1 hypothetical protein SD77_3438 [Bacillus badius]MED4715450.1 hypothetical protein [Bacillus badius]
MPDEMNGKITNLEAEMMIDESKEKLPYLIENAKITSKLLKARYESLIAEGFTEKQALEIILTRPLYE